MTWVYPYDHRHPGSPEEVTLLLGGKAANLATMAVDLGLPVPPAFTITTEACRAFLDGGWPDGLSEELRSAMAALEARVGRRFGDASDPLLVSVRSGAPRSMPGMMDTILNLGLNDATEAGLARASGDTAFARDCHARFRESYLAIVGAEAPADVWGQLRGAIEAVFRSWMSERARTYREREGISESLGTGVTVQAMVFGNRGEESGTGVLFTRNPATGEDELYGDLLFDAQGEDVVAGTHATASIGELASQLPAVAEELRRHADALERHYRDCCDIEFTIEQGRLWMLQVRVGKRTPRAALRMAVDMAEDPTFPLSRDEAVRRVAGILAEPPRVVTTRPGSNGATVLCRGLGASPGVACGEIQVTADAAVAAADEGRDVILVRPETSPDDVHGMSRSVGILTATGGFASHAAVVARGWGIPAVVGAADVIVGARAATIDGRELAAGAAITIDGATGEVFEGDAAGVSEVAPEVQVLKDWAQELGIVIGADETPADAPAASSSDGSVAAPAIGGGRAARPTRPGADATSASPGPAAAPTADDALRALLIKGYAQPDALGTALGTSTEAAAVLIDGLVANGRCEPGAGAFRLTAAGREAALALLAADRAAWGPEAAGSALDAFLDLDRRMKEVVTAWQMTGPETPNDHTDPDYDAGVIARLDELHADVEAWLAPLAIGLPRLARYGARLASAAAEVAGGNGTFIASPRVDSYHGAWFELHEDLIQLAGRTRADEVAAGRA